MGIRDSVGWWSVVSTSCCNTNLIYIYYNIGIPESIYEDREI